MVRQEWARGFSGCRQRSGRSGPRGLVVVGNGQAGVGQGVSDLGNGQAKLG